MDTDNRQLKKKIMAIPVITVLVVTLTMVGVIFWMLSFHANEVLRILLDTNNGINEKAFIQDTIAQSVHALYAKIALIGFGVCVVFSFLFVWIIKRELITRLDKVQVAIFSFLDYLSDKRKDVIAIDESVGAISKAINQKMQEIVSQVKQDQLAIENFIENVEKVRHGSYSVRLTKTPYDPLLQEAYVGVRQMYESLEQNIGRDLNEILRVLDFYAKEDYRHQITNPTGRIEVAINRLGEVLRHILGQNQRIGMQVQQKAQEVNGNIKEVYAIMESDLKKTLEDIVKEVDDAVGHIKSNVESASFISSNVEMVTDAAKEGEVLANKTAQSMSEIKEQVDSINETIGIIDKITMQTNILSLNAAVEASTAGEYGKGFSVVAQEVRTLAAQTANASKQIKEMVDLAKEKAQHGTEISHAMILGYRKLFEEISKTMNFILQITASSNLQDENFQKICLAVKELQNMVEKNIESLSLAQNLSFENYEMAQEVLQETMKKKFLDTILA